jgi:poly(3-hydroxybutyrate) depolymerase
VRVLIALLLMTAIARADDAPLLVVLHGDGERADVAAKRWRAATTKRGWKLLAPQCPRTENCKDSWWKWNGDPRWLREQIAAVKGVDAQRIYAAGWSGGATYLGMRAPAWSESFAAVVIHGGGMAPAEDTCPAHALPAYFLVGDKNPLHHLAVSLREYFARCAGALEWDLVAGGHRKEHRALDTKKALAILDWLSAHTRK